MKKLKFTDKTLSYKEAEDIAKQAQLFLRKQYFKRILLIYIPIVILYYILDLYIEYSMYIFILASFLLYLYTCKRIIPQIQNIADKFADKISDLTDNYK